MKKEIELWDLGYVKYIDHLGSDKAIVQAARHSYDDSLKGDEKDKKLLMFLYREGHSSPFEQSSITFEIKMPIFVMRQFVRHRTFRLNEMSARYTQLPDDFFVPRKWRKQDTKNKQSSFAADNWEPGMEYQGEKYSGHDDVYEGICEYCKDAYKMYVSMLDSGIAREQARLILPINIFTKVSVNIDMNNFLKFLRLRSSAHAQEEIRILADAMGEIAKDYFPWCLEAYNKYKMNITEK